MRIEDSSKLDFNLFWFGTCYLSASKFWPRDEDEMNNRSCSSWYTRIMQKPVMQWFHPLKPGKKDWTGGLTSSLLAMQKLYPSFILSSLVCISSLRPELVEAFRVCQASAGQAKSVLSLCYCKEFANFQDCESFGALVTLGICYSANLKAGNCISKYVFSCAVWKWTNSSTVHTKPESLYHLFSPFFLLNILFLFRKEFSSKCFSTMFFTSFHVWQENMAAAVAPIKCLVQFVFWSDWYSA